MNASPVQRQVVLPLSKAVEIAWKSIRLRLSRSLLVTSGIILALAFLTAILTTDAMTDAMRRWAGGNADGSGQFQLLRTERDSLTAQLNQLGRDLRSGAKAKSVASATAPVAAFDFKQHFGADFATVQSELGAMPMSESDLTAAIRNNPSLAASLDRWVTMSRQLHSIKERLTAPQQLEALMKANGVPATAEEIAASRLQTRWLLGLALLVAFVGILNAMLMSVTERFREIGTMKCLGALDSFIIKLFLIESLFQGTVGTILGIAVGLILSLLALASSYGSLAWQSIPMSRLSSNVGLCLLVGISLTVAGAVYPAWQAARMQPIEAMRVET